MEAKKQRNSEERAAMLAERARRQRERFNSFTPVLARTRLSTRGERGRPWLTKKHTASRVRDMCEALAPKEP